MSDFTDLRNLGGLRRIGGGMDTEQRIKLPPVFNSAAKAELDAAEADGDIVTDADRLAVNLAHTSNHSAAHHAALAVWRDAVAAATTDTVLLGDKAQRQRQAALRVRQLDVRARPHQDWQQT